MRPSPTRDGGVARFFRAVRRGGIGEVGGDLAFGWRLLRRQPARTAMLVLTLALGIGANTALFTIVDAVVLRPLPYPSPERLVRLWDRQDRAGLAFFSVSVPHYDAWRSRTRRFAALGAYREDGFSLVTESGPVAVDGVRMTASLFDVLGVPPALGRAFTADEDRPDGARVAVVTQEFARRELQPAAGGDAIRQDAAGCTGGGRAAAVGDPSGASVDEGQGAIARATLGRTVMLNGEAHIIIGVMPAGFRFPQQDRVEVMIPYRLVDDPAGRGAHFLRVLGRQRPEQGITFESALAELNGIARTMETEDAALNRGWTVNARPLREAIVGDVRDTLIRLQGACLLVLLIAAVNVANLLIVRASDRAREMAVRAALGAGVGRLVRQLLTESLLLAGLGTIAGLALASFLLRLAPAWLPASLPRSANSLESMSMNGDIVLFAIAISLVTGVLFGIAPAIGAVRASLVTAFASARSATSPGGFVLRRLLVGLQLGLALMLLAGAALLVQSATRLANVDRGFVAHGVLTFELQPPLASHRAPAARARLYQRIQSELAQLPGVTSVGLSHRLPLSGNSGIGLRIAGRPTPAPDEIPQINYRSVSSGYWKALGVPIVRGRVFTDAEAWERGAVAVINQAAARQFFADSDPIGQRLIIGPQSQFPEIEIIGIVADSRDASLRGPAEPMLFAPYIAMPVPAMTVIVRTSIDPATLTAAAARAVARVDGQLPIAHVQTLDRFMDDVLAQPRFTSALASLFAILALVLAAIGVYGVIAVLVAARTREIGIRLALGADPRQIVRRILSEGLRVATAGIALGIVAALLLGRLLADLLYEVTPTDPATLAAAAATLLAIAVLATIVPARRTLRIDPVRALRE